MDMEIRNEIMRKVRENNTGFPQFTTEEWLALNNPEWCQENSDVNEAVKQAASKQLNDVFGSIWEG